jgi:hypothetical protein
MDLFRASERLMRMDEAAWARHANPLSVFSRFSILPLLALAVWSRLWIGWLFLVPVAAVILWTFLNPRLFGPPAHRDGWAWHGVRGERIFLLRADSPVPRRYLRAARLLSALAALGLVAIAWGLWRLEPIATLAGLVLAMGAKAWLVDRMAALSRETPDIPLDAPGRNR